MQVTYVHKLYMDKYVVKFRAYTCIIQYTAHKYGSAVCIERWSTTCGTCATHDSL
jgi:hypothetical protein